MNGVPGVDGAVEALGVLLVTGAVEALGVSLGMGAGDARLGISVASGEVLIVGLAGVGVPDACADSKVSDRCTSCCVVIVPCSM
jgi:hypothetical protein